MADSNVWPILSPELDATLTYHIMLQTELKVHHYVIDVADHYHEFVKEILTLESVSMTFIVSNLQHIGKSNQLITKLHY